MLNKNLIFSLVDEWFWDFSVEYQLLAFAGNDVHNAIELQGLKQIFFYFYTFLFAGKTIQTSIKTTHEKSPYPEVKVVEPLDLNIVTKKKIEIKMKWKYLFSF